MKATYTLIYNRRNSLNKKGKAQVLIQVYYNKERKWLNTKIFLTPKEWDAKRNEVSAHHPASDQLNQELQEHLENLKAHEREESKAGRPLLLAKLSLDKQSEKLPSLSFSDFWQLSIENNNQLEYDTKRTHRSTLKRFREFKPNVEFYELTTELLRAFELYLLNFRIKNSKGGEKPLSYGRIHCILKTLRAYVNRAIQESYMEAADDPFQRFSIAKYRKVASQTTRKYLIPEEIHAIENLEIPDHLHYLEKIRDMFLLSCYTGLRYSDIVRLDTTCLQFTKGEGYSLYFSMQYKTKVEVLVPVYLLFERKPEVIVQKYLETLGPGEELLFGSISNQYLNRCLKQLAFLAGLEGNLTFHMARHSCATLLLDIGLSYEVVQQILGHTNIRTTQIYGKVRKETLKKALKEAKWSKKK